MQSLLCEAIDRHSTAESPASELGNLSDLSDISESDDPSEEDDHSDSVFAKDTHASPALDGPGSYPPTSSRKRGKRKRSANNAKARKKAHHAATRAQPAIERQFVPLKSAAHHVRNAEVIPETLDGPSLPTARTAFQAVRQAVEKVRWKLAEVLSLGFRYQSWDGR